MTAKRLMPRGKWPTSPGIPATVITDPRKDDACRASRYRIHASCRVCFVERMVEHHAGTNGVRQAAARVACGGDRALPPSRHQRRRLAAGPREHEHHLGLCPGDSSHRFDVRRWPVPRASSRHPPSRAPRRRRRSCSRPLSMSRPRGTAGRCGHGSRSATHTGRLVARAVTWWPSARYWSREKGVTGVPSGLRSLR